MSLEQSQGIQALLAAEKASTETINKARKKKQMRLKQAQEEAEAEVQRYKQEREQQFQSWSAQNSGSSGDTTSMMEADMKSQIQELESKTRANEKAVIDALMNAVYDVKPALHINFRQGQAN